MKAKELRTGNYVYTGKLCLPELGVTTNGNTKLTAKGIYRIEQKILEALPIPLTEDFMPILGIDYLADGQYELVIDFLHFNWDKEVGLIIFINDSTESIALEHIKYVHQFQNIVFALTNKEL